MLKVDYFFAFFDQYFEYLGTSSNTYLALEHYLVSSYQAGMYHLRNSYVIYLLSKSDDLLTLYLNILVARPWATNHVYCDSYTLFKGGAKFFLSVVYILNSSFHLKEKLKDFQPLQHWKFI
jgi:hypothetical protein